VKRYDKYKDSGVDWIGEIPEHWEVRRIKTLSLVKRGASPRPIDNPIYFDENGEYAWVRIADVTESEHYLVQTTQCLSSLGASLSIKRFPNDLFLSIAGTVGKPIITKIKCCIHDGFVWFPQLKMNPEFLYYVFISGQPYLGLGKMGTQLNLNTDTVGNIRIPIPSSTELNRIIVYLDNKTSKIDHIIATRQQQIALLKEYKASVISHAVTKGLDPNVKMKDSGVEWMGEIPEHWEVKRLKYIFNNLDYLREPISATEREKVNPQYDYYGASGIIDRIDNYNVDDTVLLIGEDGANLVYRNLPLIYRASGKFWVNNHAHILKPKDMQGYNYWAYLLEQGDYSIYISGSAQPKLNQERLNQFKLCLPPPPEQHTIAAYLDKKTAEIDSTLAQYQQQIELLKEYRSSLITEAVTGKIDVRK
jgi:type I restriction enzyme S subunit